MIQSSVLLTPTGETGRALTESGHVIARGIHDARAVFSQLSNEHQSWLQRNDLLPGHELHRAFLLMYRQLLIGTNEGTMLSDERVILVDRMLLSLYTVLGSKRDGTPGEKQLPHEFHHHMAPIIGMVNGFK